MKGDLADFADFADDWRVRFFTGLLAFRGADLAEDFVAALRAGRSVLASRVVSMVTGSEVSFGDDVVGKGSEVGLTCEGLEPVSVVTFLAGFVGLDELESTAGLNLDFDFAVQAVGP